MKCSHEDCDHATVDDTFLRRVARRSWMAIVTWRYKSSDMVYVTEHEVEWQPAERDVGVSAGPIVYGDAPPEVIEAAGEALYEELCDD